MWGALIMMHVQFGVQLADMCSAKVASKWFAGACGCWGQGFAQCVSVNLCCSSLNRAVCRPYDATCAAPVGSWWAGGCGAVMWREGTLRCYSTNGSVVSAIDVSLECVPRLTLGV